MNTRFAFQVVVAVIAGVVSAILLAPDALATASSEIVSALSILNAAIFPTVVLSATVLKASGLNRALVERYRTALRTQVSFFFGILLFSLMAIVAIIIAQSMEWSLEFTLPWTGHRFVWSNVFNFVIVFLGAFVLLRLPAFLRALTSLIDVHIDSVAEEVTEKERIRREARKKELDELPDISSHQRPPEPFAFEERRAV